LRRFAVVQDVIAAGRRQLQKSSDECHVARPARRAEGISRQVLGEERRQLLRTAYIIIGGNHGRGETQSFDRAGDTGRQHGGRPHEQLHTDQAQDFDHQQGEC